MPEEAKMSLLDWMALWPCKMLPFIRNSEKSTYQYYKIHTPIQL